MADLPVPPVPADADLRHFDDMPLEVRRLRDSGMAGVANAEIFRCAVLLWCVAWHQLPAGSLPISDADLCRLVGLGRDIRTWAELKAGVLRGWRLFADGRLYHLVVAEKVMASWNSTRLKRWNNEVDRIRKENRVREEQKLTRLPSPVRPKVIPLEWPPESAWNSAGTPTETGLNRIEGSRMDVLKEAPSGPPCEEQISPPIAARVGLEGPARDVQASNAPIKKAGTVAAGIVAGLIDSARADHDLAIPTFLRRQVPARIQ
jgi:hypothetical protein